MVYLGPLYPRPAPVKTSRAPAAASALNPYTRDSLKLEAVGPPDGIERRKQERRRQSGQTIVETRAGRDRRRSPQTTINISV